MGSWKVMSTWASLASEMISESFTTCEQTRDDQSEVSNHQASCVKSQHVSCHCEQEVRKTF